MLACGLALAACNQTTGSGPQAAAPLPSDYREQIIAKVRDTFFDPYSIRDASISQPIAGAAFAGPVSTVCIRANAKNRMGGYIGLKQTSFTFRDGKLTVADSEYAAMTCGQAVYEPFPEIEEGYKPAAAAPKIRR